MTKRGAPNLKYYSGKDPVKRMKAENRNRFAQEAAAFVKADFAKCSGNSKFYAHQTIAQAIGCDTETARDLLYGARWDGITIFRENEPPFDQDP